MEFKEDKGKEFNGETHYNKSGKNQRQRNYLESRKRERRRKGSCHLLQSPSKRIIADFL